MQKEDISRTERCASSDCVTGQRNRFFRGKQMRAEEHRLEQQYGIERRRLLNRAVVGWGVVYGFSLSLDQGEGDGAGALRVQRGMALDPHGREIVVEEALVLNAANTFVRVQTEGGAQLKPVQALAPGRYLLSVHYAERRFGDAKLLDDCSCEHNEKNFVCETALFSLSALPSEGGCPCGEHDCQHAFSCAACDDCGVQGRGPHAQLCRWVADAEVADGHARSCQWQDYWLSPHDAVPLACVTVGASEDKCKPLSIGSIDDACGPRRLVKSNDLLYGLLRGCDLTRVTEISWQDWHRSTQDIAWSAFRERFGEEGRTEFTVRFSHPVQLSSLTPEVITITVYTREQSTGWLLARRVPTAVEPLEDTQEATTEAVRLLVNTRWCRDEIESDKESWLSENDFTVEIEIHGDLILDCNHQSVDANARDLRGVPTGNGSPGGTFISRFRVEPKPCDRDSEDDGDRQKSRKVS